VQRFFQSIKQNLPLVLVIFVAIFIGLQNISARGFYTGWDNVHAEFDLAQYANRVFYGTWNEHEGLGGPSAKGLLTEITRIPILFLLQQIFPQNLIRSVFIFLMYTTGGISMYLYLKKIWIKQKIESFQSWLAGVGALLYLLHPLTTQQFYISFEMFTVQFAFFPLLLITIHLLAKKISWKNILIFSLVQIALASSAHTPTVYYLGALFSCIYAFGVYFKNHPFKKTIAFTFLIGLLTLALNAYWILPNIYYSLNNSHYVSESRTNILFRPEALWSIRESSTLHSFLTGYHYLTTWKDFNFSIDQHELLFNEWQTHFANPTNNDLLYVLSIGTILGIFFTIKNKNRGPEKWSVTFIYGICVLFIWFELFPLRNIILDLYSSQTFFEAFKNPFTKLSILYSFFVVILFIEFLAEIMQFVKKHFNKKLASLISWILIIVTSCSIIYVSLPNLQGNLISEKLRVIFPPEYQELYKFMHNQNPKAKVLEMPYLSSEGWVLYDWSTPKHMNGYQGIGFQFFGIEQPFFTPDFGRWSEVNDFFYTEIQQARNSNNAQLFETILEKYHVPMIILDQSRITSYKELDFEAEIEFIQKAGFNKIWENNFISVYEHPEIIKEATDFIVPKELTFIEAQLRRVKTDVIYPEIGEYLNLNQNNILFPFTNLLQEQIGGAEFEKNSIIFEVQIPQGDYQLKLPSIIQNNVINTTIAIEKTNKGINIYFPQHILITDNQEKIIFPGPENIVLDFKNQNFETLFINQKVIQLQKDKIQYQAISLSPNNPLIIATQQKKLFEYNPDWSKLVSQTNIKLNNINQLTLLTEFPTILADLTKQPSENCSKPQLGEIETTFAEGSATYKAKNFGVNCNALDISFMNPTQAYLMNIQGENILGRSTKVFIHYSPENTIPEQYILPEGKFSTTLPFSAISADPTAQFYLNWETRSFGSQSINIIDSIQIMPVPLDQLAQIALYPDSLLTHQQENNIQIESTQKHSITRYSLQASCSGVCYFGLNQAYDDLWLAYDATNNVFLEHTKYNNWANMWQTKEGQSTIIIFYLPQVFAFGGMILVIGIILPSIVFTFKKAN
jgi:hypothetical protein